MSHSAHIPRGKLQPGSRVPGRQIEPITAIEQELPSPAEFMAKAFADMQRHLQALVKLQVDDTLIFDEYQSQGLVALSTSSISIQPTYEFTERVESIIITGPAGACTLQLGDRVWTITIPAAGIYVIAPVAIYLGRDDTRTLSASTAGDYTLELMGHADRRWST